MTFDAHGFQNRAGYDNIVTEAASVAAVPESATWLMMIIGFGAIGGVMRRAHRKSEEKFTRKVRSLATA